MGFKLNRQHWGDSFKLMPHVPAGKVDLVLYSPPYIAGKGYEDETSSGLAAYKHASDLMFAEVARVLKPTGVFALEVGYFQHPAKGGFDPQLWQGKNTIRPMMYELWPLLEKHGLHVVQEIVWHFRGGFTGHPSRPRLFNRHEYIVILSPDPANIYFSREELRDWGANVSYSSANNKFGAAPSSIWADGDAMTNYRLREIARAMSEGDLTEAEARLAATETIADFLAPGVTGAVGEFMRLAAKLKPDACGIRSHAEPLRDINKVIADVIPEGDTTTWLIERVAGEAKHKYHECPFPLELADNIIRLFSRPEDLVLDPFAGSCMVGKAALLSGRHFLAFERDEYWKTVVSLELRRLKLMLRTWQTDGIEGIPDPPCPDALTYVGDDVDLRIRCLHARRALQAFYLARMGELVKSLRRKGHLPEKGSKHDEVISESGLCPCPHCRAWLR